MADSHRVEVVGSQADTVLRIRRLRPEVARLHVARMVEIADAAARARAQELGLEVKDSRAILEVTVRYTVDVEEESDAAAADARDPEPVPLPESGSGPADRPEPEQGPLTERQGSGPRAQGREQGGPR